MLVQERGAELDPPLNVFREVFPLPFFPTHPFPLVLSPIAMKGFALEIKGGRRIRLLIRCLSVVILVQEHFKFEISFLV